MWTAPWLGECLRHMRGETSVFARGRRTEELVYGDPTLKLSAVEDAESLQAGNGWVGDLSHDDLSRHH